MEYYFTSKNNIEGENLTIRGDDFKHLTKVLRKKSGETIFVTDGERNLYKCEIGLITKDSIKCRVLEKSYNTGESAIKVSLYLSLIKNPARFEFAIEKATELGVSEIIPIITKNAINKNRDKAERWQTIALAAMKQSQRTRLPEIKHPISFNEAISLPGLNDTKLIADERLFDNSIFASELKQIIRKNKDISVFIGPEGGFTDEEIQTAVKKGFVTLNLGDRKIRSETAAVAVLSIILTK
jgi:16S rRNA (uracil1498-N3)-methyltransferase